MLIIEDALSDKPCPFTVWIFLRKNIVWNMKSNNIKFDAIRLINVGTYIPFCLLDQESLSE
jgi:hypothetical protein